MSVLSLGMDFDPHYSYFHFRNGSLTLTLDKPAYFLIVLGCLVALGTQWYSS